MSSLRGSFNSNPLLRTPLAGQRGHDEGNAPCRLKSGTTGADMPFHNNIIGNFMVYEDRLEKSLLQLFQRPEN